MKFDGQMKHVADCKRIQAMLEKLRDDTHTKLSAIEDAISELENVEDENLDDAGNELDTDRSQTLDALEDDRNEMSDLEDAYEMLIGQIEDTISTMTGE